MTKSYKEIIRKNLEKNGTLKEFEYKDTSDGYKSMISVKYSYDGKERKIYRIARNKLKSMIKDGLLWKRDNLKS